MVSLIQQVSRGGTVDFQLVINLLANRMAKAITSFLAVVRDGNGEAATNSALKAFDSMFFPDYH